MTLREQIYAASERNGDVSRLAAISAFKARALDRETARDLCDCLQGDLSPAERTVVAQILGYHKVAVRFPEVGTALYALAERENDIIALRALVFALQGCDVVTHFLSARNVGVVLEAVIGAPVHTLSLQALLFSAFNGLPNRPFEALCGRLLAFENIVPHVVAFLMTAEFKDVGQAFDERVRQIFAVLPKGTLFESLIDVRGELERTYKTIWPGIWRRERQRRLLEQFVEMIAEKGADDVLIDGIFNRVMSDEQSYGHYVRFVRAFLGVLNTKMALAWIATCDVWGEKADRALLSRLAETLITLVRTSPLIIDEAQAVLGKWEPQLPGVRMKAFHATR
jgi:hypothetical protein